jgi:hypothetical protein
MGEPVMAVLSTPELLDLILLWSEPLDLVRLQCVCGPFRFHVAPTKALQRRLFLQADPVLVNTRDVDDKASSASRNELMPKDILPNPFMSHIFPSPSDRTGTSMSGEQIYEQWSIAEQLACWDKQKFFLLKLPLEEKLNGAMNNPETSWRSMTVSQPPVSHIAVFMAAQRYPGEEHPRSPDYQVISNSQGVRLGEIVDHARARAHSAFLKEAPLAIVGLQMASYERIYSACYNAFLRHHVPKQQNIPRSPCVDIPGQL